MSGSFRLRLDRSGIGEILKKDCAPMVEEYTAAAAARVDAATSSDVTVTHRTYTTDRAAGAVVIEDVRGMALQAKYGVLTRAATGTGVEVTQR